MMTNNERTELELYIDVLNSLIGDFYVITSRYNISLDKDDNVGAYYRSMLQCVDSLRRTTSYEDVLEAKEKIAEIKRTLAKLEVGP